MRFESLWADFGSVVEQVAADGGRQYRAYGADRGDFQQELSVWMLENEDFLASKREEMDDDEAFARFLAKCLRNEVTDYGFDIRAQAGGQDRSTAYWYSTAELKELLSSVFNEEAWHNPPSYGGETRSRQDPATGNNWIATLADVSQAFAKLNKPDKDMLHALHRDGWMNKDLAKLHGISESLMSYRHGQALKRLLRILGDEKPRHMRPHDEYDPWRGRHAISNAAARAITSGYYEEG